MIDITHVVKTFNGRAVICDLNMQIKQGELFVVIGPSGTGKSVTLRLISGQMAPTSGKVVIMGQDLSELDSEALAALRGQIGYLFQSGALLGWMTLAENVALPLQEHTKLSKQEIGRRVQEALEDVGLGQAGDRYPSEVSGGMVKRAGFARAIIERPKILLFDEPTSGLDPVMSRTIDQLILSLNKKYGMTCVVVTHDLTGALHYADRIGMLREGAFAEIITPDQIAHTQTQAFQDFKDAQFIF